MNLKSKKKFIALGIAGVAALILMLAPSIFSRAGVGASATRGITVFHREAPYNKAILSEQLGVAIKSNEYPNRFSFMVDGVVKKAQVQYTLHEPSQALMQKLMGQYQPDYGAFVAMDAKSGRILSLVSYSKSQRDSENLTLRASFPSASIFKVVTASAAIDLNKANPETVVPFNGALHTLYKRNVASTKETRWTTRMTLRDAFARSVNTFFSKLGLFYVGPQNLAVYAERFLFNHPIQSDIPVQQGKAKISAEDPWGVAAAASGFTKENTMSPVHGALIAAAIANDGVMMEPFVVDSLHDEAGEIFYRGEPRSASIVMEPQSADGLRELFRQTVKSGTSRKSFRQTVRRSAFDDIEFGGKTGSLMGENPNGKCDWFVGYARYRDQRIAVAALTVNEKKWKVKSSMLANLFFQRYMRDLKKQESLADAR